MWEKILCMQWQAMQCLIFLPSRRTPDNQHYRHIIASTSTVILSFDHRQILNGCTLYSYI